MDKERKIRLVEAMASSKAKGNDALSEAVRIALEECQANQMSAK